VTARGLHLPLQAADKRCRQGTQGQRQVGAGLRRRRRRRKEKEEEEEEEEECLLTSNE